MIDRFTHDHVTLTDAEAARLTAPRTGDYTVTVQPPATESVPTTLEYVARELQELQSGAFGIRNYSPVCTLELRRHQPDQLWLQFSVPTKRMERKLRLHLNTACPDIGYSDGTTGLPVTEEDTVGGGLLTVGRDDWFPLRTEFPRPPLTAVANALHQDAMRDTRFVIQVMFQPVAGHPVRRWYWTKRAYKQVGYLNKEKEKLWGSRSATPREKRQANAVEAKASQPVWWCSIRVAVVGAGEHTRSRLKEVAGAFNVFENPETNQYLNVETVTPLRRTNMVRFLQAVADRAFKRWSRRFRVTTEELGGLIAVPGTDQQNVQFAPPG